MARLPGVQYDLIQLGGGLDQVTPTLSLPSGVARRAARSFPPSDWGCTPTRLAARTVRRWTIQAMMTSPSTAQRAAA